MNDVRLNSPARVQPVEVRYLIEPGTCAICGKAPNPGEVWANPMIELPEYGFIYFCVPCCLEIGSFALMVSKENHAMLLRRYNEILSLNIELTEKVKRLKELLDVRIDSGDSSSVPSVNISDLPILEDPSDPDEIARLLAETESGTLKSGSSN